MMISLISKAELAMVLGVTTRSIDRMVARGSLPRPSSRVGNRPRWSVVRLRPLFRDDFDAMLIEIAGERKRIAEERAARQAERAEVKAKTKGAAPVATGTAPNVDPRQRTRPNEQLHRNGSRE